MKKKGFTLIELLAVIVILAVVSLIATPMILGVIEKARTSANKSSAVGMLEAAEVYFSKSLFDNSKQEQFDGQTNLLNEITIKGEQPDSGTVLINEQGKVSLAVTYDDKCYVKKYEDTKITEVENNYYDCSIPTLDVWDGTVEEITPVDGVYYAFKGSHLAWISEQVENGKTFEGETIVLKNNIDMGAEFDEEGNLLNDSKYKFTPIGNATTPFYGSFDGENNYITNLYVNETTKFIGLFGRFYGPSFKNLTVKDSYIKSAENVVGIIGGNRTDSQLLSIINVKSLNNKIEGNSYVGGVVGQLFGNIENCNNKSTVISNSVGVGGIVGVINIGGVSDSTNYGTITGASYGVGGIVGFLQKEADAINNTNHGTVQGEVKWIGGIVGIHNSSSFAVVSNNINEGKVTTLHGAIRVAGIVGNANDNILLYNNINKGDIDGIGDGTSTSYGTGGIVGTIGFDANDRNESTPSYLLNCYNLGNVKGRDSAGGIAGNLYDTTISVVSILNSYNEGTVEATNGYAGGIIGAKDTAITEFASNSYNKGTVKGGKAAGGLIGYNIGISNSINYANVEGTSNDGVIGAIKDNGDVKIENVYYLNTLSSKYGVAKSLEELNNDFAKTVLGTSAWNYTENYPKLYKAEASVVDGKLNVSYLPEILK